MLDGRNAAAVFNAAAMAAGGGRGIGSLFSGDGIVDNVEINGNGLRLDEATLGAITSGHAQGATAHMHPPQQHHRQMASSDTTSDDGASGSEISAATSMESSNADGTDRSSESDFSSNAGGAGGRNGRRMTGEEEGEVWSGGMSCVVGLQKRGLRGLMEGRRMRERGRGGVNGAGG